MESFSRLSIYTTSIFFDNRLKRQKETNAPLKNYCSQKGLGCIENNGIKEVHLGKKRLHLNKKGNSVLAKKICSVKLREKNDLFFPLT